MGKPQSGRCLSQDLRTGCVVERELMNEDVQHFRHARFLDPELSWKTTSPHAPLWTEHVDDRHEQVMDIAEGKTLVRDHCKVAQLDDGVGTLSQRAEGP